MRRMLALEGSARPDAAHAAGMDRQTLRDGVHRYNEAGLAGLHNKSHQGLDRIEAGVSIRATRCIGVPAHGQTGPAIALTAAAPSGSAPRAAHA